MKMPSTPRSFRLFSTDPHAKNVLNTNLPALKQQLAETERAIDNMLNAIQQGILTSSTKKRLDDLEDNKSKLEISISQEEMEKPLLTREQVTFFMQKYRTMDVTKQEERQRMIDTFINSVYVYDEGLCLPLITRTVQKP